MTLHNVLNAFKTDFLTRLLNSKIETLINDAEQWIKDYMSTKQTHLAVCALITTSHILVSASFVHKTIPRTVLVAIANFVFTFHAPYLAHPYTNHLARVLVSRYPPGHVFWRACVYVIPKNEGSSVIVECPRPQATPS